MRLIFQILGGVLLLATAACSSRPIRVPASEKTHFDNSIVTGLRSAAINGVLFQFSDSLFRDVAFQQVDECRKTEVPSWSANFLQLLQLLNQNPQFYQKFHMVEFKRGDHTKVEILKDIDGLSTLAVSYSKHELRDHVTVSTIMPCGDAVGDSIGKELVIATIEWPSVDDIITVLSAAPPKEKITRFNFNTDFLVYLAERQTLLKINPEVAFERSYQGEYFLTIWLEQMAQEMKDPKTKLDFLNYWLKEISLRSKQGNQVEFFGLHLENPISCGVEINTIGKFARKISSLQEPTNLFMSYSQSNGDYVYNGLQELNDCLQKLTGLYTNPIEMGTSLDLDPDGFLSPGYSCQSQDEPGS